ncbi:MAG: shikimate dehydrogenase [Conexivisphaerales archaeon]
MMNGKMYCLIGKDVSYSPTAAMMNSAFEHLAIDAKYALENCSDIQDAINRSSGYDGFNVTMPFKVAILGFLAELDDNAKITRSVNTVKRSGNKLIGFNTDVTGASECLKLHLADRMLDRVLIVGNGGVARSFIHVAYNFGAREVVIIARDPAKARELSDYVFFDRLSLDIESLEKVDASRLGRFDLAFNATPIGSVKAETPKKIEDLVTNCDIFFDAVYRPVNTKLIIKARAAGAEIIFGYEMLLYQAIESFRIFTGKDAPLEVMKNTLFSILGVDHYDR